MAKRKILVDRLGNVKALCDNKLEYIPGLGPKQIHRAADVEFNNTRQVWEIIVPGGEIIGEHPRRDEAIKLEISLMEKRIKETRV